MNKFITKKACNCAISLLLITGMCIGCSNDSKKETAKPTGEVKVEKKVEKPVFTFNQAQIDFFKKIGIQSVGTITDKGSTKEFYYDGETIIVTLNPNNGITEVKAGKYGTDVIWNDKSGKIGMLKGDKLAFLDKFIDNHSQKYDQAQQVTWVDSGGNYPLGHKGVFTYMGIRGREKSGQKWLRATIHYSDDSWVFFNKITFSNTKESWTYTVPGRVTHQVVSGGIHEYIDVPFSDLRRGMEIIAYGENPKVDFLGNDYHDDKLCTAHEVQNAKNYLILEDALSY